ncbi:aromatic ring-opening dioxygenase LigA, partial [Sanguibacter sp. YZGR15]|nr:aromatic ring-opening dioxygenase LigA [Sanguibacter suaedae]
MKDTSTTVKLIGTLLVAAGLALVLAGGTTWIMVRSQLVAENITVAE